jgi:hypothetical protein
MKLLNQKCSDFRSENKFTEALNLINLLGSRFAVLHGIIYRLQSSGISEESLGKSSGKSLEIEELKVWV